MNVKCIDVSRYNGNIDFKKVKASGIKNVIIRCGFTGYGSSQTTNEDANFETNYKKAKEAGLNVGAYYYAVALTEADAKREAAFVLSLLKGKQFELPIYYDVEDNHSTSGYGVLKQNMQGLSRAKLTSVVNTFCETVQNAGYFVGVYSGKYWFRDNLDMNVINRYTIWLAHWTTKTDYTGPYAMWQYTYTGSVAGISGNVDMNEMYMDFPTIIKSKGLNGFTKKEQTKKYVEGDIDGDGKVGSSDARLAMRAAVGLENLSSEQIKRGDTDNDGKITSSDARIIMRRAVGLDTPPVVGDVNEDGKVTEEDAIIALRAVAGVDSLTDRQIVLSDVDDDGKITMDDLVQIMKLAHGVDD